MHKGQRHSHVLTYITLYFCILGNPSVFWGIGNHCVLSGRIVSTTSKRNHAQGVCGRRRTYYTAIYGSESWTWPAECEKNFAVFEHKSLRKLLKVSYQERKATDFVFNKVRSLLGPKETLLAVIKKSKLQSYGHMSRHNSLTITIMEGPVKGETIQTARVVDG